MSIHIYNSLSRKKEEFIPLDPAKVNIYSCGVTVYDECHIGHARSLYIFEVIRRYLKYRGFDVRFARNITDIDDKIINRANELKIDWNELVKKYIDRYYEDLAALDIDKADIEPRATENIADMVKHIRILIDKGYAYETDTGVYFSVRKFRDYGKLSGQNIQQILSGVRKEADETKEDFLDFALWKKSKPGEPVWPSPWGDGRPGWHIECSVMSTKYLRTDTLDIHAGGRDLIFPHHENEIAQAEALTGKTFAKYWIHHGLLTINGQKMSKSLGNFVTIKDALKKYHPDILKIFYLQAHYSSPIDFSEAKIAEATQAYERICISKKKLEQKYGTLNLEEVVKSGAGFIKPFKDQFIEYMDDDFNTPRGLSVLFDMVNICNKTLEDEQDNLRDVKLRYALEIIREMAGVFGLTFFEVSSGEISDDQISFHIAARSTYKKQKKFKEADEIRKNLEEKGIILEDTKDGKTTWRRKL
jgi:cysteinyl-tRNA synthetase